MCQRRPAPASAALSPHVPRAEIEGLGEGEGKTVAPLGLVYGFPLFLWMKREPGGQYAFSLISHNFFPFQTAEARATWGDQISCIGFICDVSGGRIGTGAFNSGLRRLWISVAPSALFIRRLAGDLVYDEEGKLKVEVTLAVTQHTNA